MRFGSRGPSLRYVTVVNWRRRPGKRRTRTRRSLEQGTQFHYSVSWTGCLSGPDALNRVWTLVVLCTCLVCSVFYNCKSSFTPNKRKRKVDDVIRAYVEKRLSYPLFQLIADFQDLVQRINSTLFRCSHDAYHANYRNMILQLLIQNIKQYW